MKNIDLRKLIKKWMNFDVSRLYFVETIRNKFLLTFISDYIFLCTQQKTKKTENL